MILSEYVFRLRNRRLNSFYSTRDSFTCFRFYATVVLVLFDVSINFQTNNGSWQTAQQVSSWSKQQHSSLPHAVGRISQECICCYLKTLNDTQTQNIRRHHTFSKFPWKNGVKQTRITETKKRYFQPCKCLYQKHTLGGHLQTLNNYFWWSVHGALSQCSSTFLSSRNPWYTFAFVMERHWQKF